MHNRSALNIAQPKTAGQGTLGESFGNASARRRALWMFGTLVTRRHASIGAGVDRSCAPDTRRQAPCSQTLWSLIPAALATAPKKPLRLPGYRNSEYDIARTQKVDGSPPWW